jgi:glutamine synthetase
MDRQQEYVLRTIEERNIRFVRLWFSDVLGTLKSVSIAPAELEQAFEEGVGFDGSAIEGFTRVYESDMLARPDASTFQILPWGADDGGPGSARMICDIHSMDGSPSWADPRHVLRRALSRASDLGFTFYIHPEIEFYLFRREEAERGIPVPADHGGYFDLSTHDVAHGFRRASIATLERMGVSVEFSHHEVAPGQQEIDLRYADALTMADNTITFRHVIREVARMHGVYASFMPKPFTDQPGSGMHTHLSLFEGDQNAFHDGSDPYGLSPTAKKFIAGLLHHAREITAVTNQWVNSYKRLVAGFEAPPAVSWGHANRSAMVRVPAQKSGKGHTTRVEIRSPDSAVNPYLAFAVMLAAGLRGIQQGYELPPPAEDDMWSLSDAERRAMGYQDLPHNLAEALRAMEPSDLVAETLGEHVFDFFLRNKRQEWSAYRRVVTEYELKKDLPVL